MINLILSSLCLVASTPAVSPQILPELVFSLKPDKNPDAMAEERESFEKFLTQKLGRKARVVVPQSAAVILQGLQNSQIDVAFIGSVDMIEAQKAGSAEILAAVSFNGKTSYESYWLTLKDKTYQSIQDLKGKPVAFASRTSTSGLIIPWDAMIRAEFIKRGQRPEVFFGEKNVLYGSGYMSAVEMLFQGRAEAAAVSDYVFNTDNYLKPEQKAKLRILQRQGPVPTHVLAIRKSLGAEAKKLLSQLVGELNQKENESLRNKLFNSDLVPVDAEKHLAPTKAALERTEIRLN